MRNHIALKRFSYRISTFLTPALAAVATLLGLINEVNPTEEPYINWPNQILDFCSKLQANSLLLFILIGVFTFLSVIINRWGDPWVLEKLQFILNEYQAKAFSAKATDPNHHHRVTLFKFKKWVIFTRHCTGSWYWPWGKHMPWSGWLIPVLRSGHTSQNTNVIFSAPDNADEAEGVAGQAWVKQNAVVYNDLPSPSKNGPKRNIKQYCEVTTCPQEMVLKRLDQGKAMPLSIAATPVEVNGRIWGVVVLDSRSKDGVSNDSILNYELTVALIGQLLEKAK